MTSTSGEHPELQTRIHQQEVVADLGQQALGTDDLNQLMHDASVAVAETLDNEYAKVLELLPGGDEVFLRQGVGWQEGLVGNATVPTDLDSQAGYTLITEEPVIVDDLRTEKRFSGPDLLTDHGVVSGISVIIGSIEEPWGVLGTHTMAEREFTNHDANFVQSVANVLAAAIDRADKEQRLRESETQLDVASKAGSIGLWTWDIKENIVTADEYLVESYGMDPEVVATGAPMEDFYEPIHEDDTEQTWEQLERAVEEIGELDVEYRVRDATGDITWIVARGEVEYDDDGEPVRVNGAISDITERKEREQELKRALDLLEKTERIADVGGWEIDTETQDVFWTDHIFELLDVDADEEPPLDEALDMYHEEDQPLVESAVEEALDSGDPFDAEVRIRTNSGEIHWLRLQGIPETVDDEVVSFRGAVQDITERKERERRLEEVIERLEESNERLEQFAHAASHDLQEPLRMVSSYLQLIEKRYADELDADGEEFIGFAVDGADRMRAMIAGLLQYSRVEMQGNPFESVNLDTVFEDVLTDLQQQIEETDAEITVENLPRVEGDAGQLRQVFQNFLSNAIEYSGDESPRIHVSTERNGTEWTISVRDEGIGIPPEAQERIFAVFQRLHTVDEHRGTGIGLALCERIIERHGGEIAVDSEPGEGATFSVTLSATSDPDT